MKEWRKDIIAVAFLLAAAGFFFLPYLTGQSIPYAGDFTGSDLTELNLPFRFLAGESWRAGQAPLWTDLIANGFPLLAEGQAGVFYPFNILFFTFLPFIWAVNLSLLLNFFLAGLFIYLYCRILKISRFGSILAAMAFSFSGFFVFRLKHLNLINAAIWLPLEFYLIEKYFAGKKKINWLILLSVVFAVQFFAGHPQISYICLLASFAYFCLKLFFADQGKLRPINFAGKIVWPWLILGILTFGLTAIQFLPSYELAQTSTRQNLMNYESATQFSLAPKEFLTIFSPYLFANPAVGRESLAGIFWEDNFYFGLIPLVLAALALVFLGRKKPVVKIFFWLLLLALFFILGKDNFLFFRAWEYLPGLKLFRFPQRFLLPLILILTVLAGFGFDLVWGKIQPRLLKNKKREKSKIFFFGLPLIIVLLAVTDLFFAAFSYIGAMPAEYFLPPKSAEFLKSDQEIFRVYSFDWQNSWRQAYLISDGWLNSGSLYLANREIIPPNLNSIYGLAASDDRGWQEGGQLNPNLAKFWQALKSQATMPADKKSLELSPRYLQLAGLENVKYFLAPYSLTGKDLELVKQIKRDFLPPINIYQNKQVLPRVFAVFSATEINDDEKAINRLLDKNFDLRQNIIVAGQPAENAAGKGKAEVAIVKLTAGEIEVKADFSQVGWLFFSQTYDPGWQVLADNQPAKLVRADLAFSAVELPAGEHLVKFYYQPQMFVWGRDITLATVIFILVILAGGLVLKRKNSLIMLNQAQLDQAHQSVPPDYYQAGMKKNILQKFWHSRRFILITKEIKKLNITGRVLDLGCHSGDLTNIISQAAAGEVYGLDLSGQAIAYAQDRFPKIHFISADFSQKTSFSENYFQAVTAFDVLEHLPNIPSVLEEIKRLLASGGYLIIGVPAENLLFKITWWFWLKFKGQVWEGTHINEFKDKDFAVFTEKGFSKIKEKKIILGMWRFIIFELKK